MFPICLYDAVPFPANSFVQQGFQKQHFGVSLTLFPGWLWKETPPKMHNCWQWNGEETTTLSKTIFPWNLHPYPPPHFHVNTDSCITNIETKPNCLSVYSYCMCLWVWAGPARTSWQYMKGRVREWGWGWGAWICVCVCVSVHACMHLHMHMLCVCVKGGGECVYVCVCL